MNNRLSRILTRWLKDHPVYGLDLMLASVVMDEGDEARLLIKDARLPVTIYNDVDDDCLAKRYNPTVVPAVAIIPQVTTSVPTRSRGTLIYKDVTVALSYLEREQPEILSRQRGGYVMTGMTDSLLAFNEPRISNVAMPSPGTTTWRRLGDIEVLEMTALEELRVTLGVGGANMFGSLLATFTIQRHLRTPS